MSWLIAPHDVMIKDKITNYLGMQTVTQLYRELPSDLLYYQIYQRRAIKASHPFTPIAEDTSSIMANLQASELFSVKDQVIVLSGAGTGKSSIQSAPIIESL